MIEITKSGDRIIGSVLGTPFNVEFCTVRFTKMQEVETALESCETMADAQAIVEKDFMPLLEVTTAEKVKTECPHLFVDERSGQFYLTSNGKISSIAMPQVLVDKIFYAMDKGLSVEPVVKFWTRLLRNPNIREREDGELYAKYISEYISATYISPILQQEALDAGYSQEKAVEMATIQQTPLTKEGLVNTKKVVRPLYDRTMYKYVLDDEGNSTTVLKDGFTKTINEDTGEVTINEPAFSEDWIFEPAMMRQSGDAFHCGELTDATLGHTIEVGKETALSDWSQVDCSFSRSCVKGLHTGNQDYINGLENSSNVTLNCFVDPMNIGAVCNGDNVMRVLRLFPHSIKDREAQNRNLYHSSRYAALNDSRWAEMRQEAVEKFTQKIEDLTNQLNEEVEELNAI